MMITTIATVMLIVKTTTTIMTVIVWPLLVLIPWVAPLFPKKMKSKLVQRTAQLIVS